MDGSTWLIVIPCVFLVNKVHIYIYVILNTGYLLIFFILQLGASHVIHTLNLIKFDPLSKIAADQRIEFENVN